ncbi:hypothetical protein H257_08773 [Aphanomyces astaci]|uniref:DDE-1 domain-containing protein n=1 Tax=Aphanomyces astaci TaxID=112090 RepID=W4GCB0_APHAT|nr:hypothetical protein H257_08773 [Aphanomyces astaci]ETV77327.1 hypothetical protein H257_08773 [Aphanomyces astaci]|eukprot:XP_009833114.1 hypothetical protein H257_08773 [Aphanomyces astaci]
MDAVCSTYDVNPTTVWRIFKRGQATKAASGVANVATRIKGNTGRRPTFSPDEVEQRVKCIPLHKRQTYRSLAAATGLFVFVLWTYVRKKWMTCRSSWTRPYLKDSQKAARLDFYNAFTTGSNNIEDMLNMVHVDEKWFYLTKLRRRFLLWHDEKIMPRHLQSKSHITKVMFLVAVARPREDWDDEISCWKIVERGPAQRSSHNRPAGTEVLKTVTVTKDVYRKLLVDFVVPAIKDKWKWPADDARRSIVIQQDNARGARTSQLTMLLLLLHPKMETGTFRSRTNQRNLGFFNSIQALQQALECQTMDELIDAVKEA